MIVEMREKLRIWTREGERERESESERDEQTEKPTTFS